MRTLMFFAALLLLAGPASAADHLFTATAAGGFFCAMDWLQPGLLCGAGFVAWTLNTLSAGGGGLLLIPAVTALTGSAAVELMANPARILAFRRDVDVEASRRPGERRSACA